MAFSDSFDKTSTDFARALVAGVSIHIFASNSFDWFERAVHGDFSAPEHWPVLLISALVAIVFALWMKHEDTLTSLWPWLWFFGFLVFQWTASAVHHLVSESGSPHLDPLSVVVALALALLLWWVYTTAEKDIPGVIVNPPEPVAPPDGKELVSMPMTKANSLIMFLSTFNSFPADRLPKWTVIEDPLDPTVFATPKLLVDNLRPAMGFHDLKSLDPLKVCNWYMPLKAIQTHVTLYPDTRNLQVVVLPSADGRVQGSWRQADEFSRLVQRLAAPGTLRVQVTLLQQFEKGVSYEDLSDLSKALRLAKIYIKERDPEGLIVVDITGRQGTCSAVAGALTLEHRERIQYVSTTNNSVTMFDLRYEPLRLPLET